MRISINNLGPIPQGVLDISKRLTIFCGPNNTGKTYVSYIIYAMLKSRRFFPVMDIPSVSDLFANGKLTFDIIREDILQYRKKCADVVNGGKESIFGISESDSKNLFSNLSVSFSLSDDEFFTKAIDTKLDYLFRWDSFIVRVEKKAGSSLVLLQKEGSDINAEVDSFIFEWQLVSDIYDRLINYPYVKASIFPVERISVYTFNKELSIQRNELIEQMQALKDNKKIGYESVDKLLGRSTRYPLAIRDCLSVANDLSNLKKKKGEFASFADEIEERLLKGKLSVMKNGDVQFVPKSGQKLPVQLSASIVKTLSSLTFYLKHLAQKGDLVIIDEPEMNLHPDAQVRLTRVLAQLMNCGINMLVSTHSDYIVRELNNLISMGSLGDNKSLMEELGYHKNELIKHEDVAVYLFKPLRKNSKNAQIVEVPVLPDGFSIQTIDDVINKTNDYLDRIQYSMQYESRN